MWDTRYPPFSTRHTQVEAGDRPAWHYPSGSSSALKWKRQPPSLWAMPAVWRPGPLRSLKGPLRTPPFAPPRSPTGGFFFVQLSGCFGSNAWRSNGRLWRRSGTSGCSRSPVLLLTTLNGRSDRTPKVSLARPKRPVSPVHWNDCIFPHNCR